MQETRTARIAADRLRGAGFDVTEGIGNTGVVGLRRSPLSITTLWSPMTLTRPGASWTRSASILAATESLPAY